VAAIGQNPYGAIEMTHVRHPVQDEEQSHSCLLLTPNLQLPTSKQCRWGLEFGSWELTRAYQAVNPPSMRSSVPVT
jgi:hypothetical protein